VLVVDQPRRAQVGRLPPALVAGLVLVLGVVPCAAVFSAVNGVLLRPPAYDAPERVIALWESHPPSGRLHEGVSPLDYRDWGEASTAIEPFALWEPRSATLRGDFAPLRVNVVRSTPELFAVLGANAQLGRTFSESHGVDEPAVVISDGLWRRQFGASPSVLGQAILIDDTQHQVIGVMPRDFQFPPGVAIDLWMPARISTAEWRIRSARRFRAIGRLAATAPLEQATQEMVTIAKRLSDDHPGSNDGWTVAIEPLRATDRERAAPLLVLLGGATLVLLLAALTAAALLTVRDIARVPEWAVRAALGASPMRLISASLVRNGAPVIAACVLGTLIAVPVTPWLFALGAGTLVGDYELGMDRRVLAFGIVLSLAAAAIASIAPAVTAARLDLAAVLNGRNDAARHSRSMLRVRRLVSAIQIAVAVVLLTGTGLVGQSVWRLLGSDPGFRAEGVLAASFSLPTDAFGPRAARFYDDIATKVRMLPDVSSAAVVTALPMSPTEMDEFWLAFQFEGEPEPPDEAKPRVQFRAVSPGYFTTLNRPIVAGRDFTAADAERSAPLRAIVSESVVRQYSAGTNPIGRRIRLSMGGWYEIVGVTNDVRFRGLDDAPRAEIFTPFSRWPFPGAHLIARTSRPLPALASDITGIARAADPAVPVARVAPLSDLVADTAAMRRFALAALASLATIAWVVGLLGTYGLVAHAAMTQRGELTVRAALGAQPGHLVWLTIREGLLVAAAGAFLGLIAAAALSAYLASVLFETPARDPATLAAAAAVQIVTATAAAWWASRSVARLNPAATLT
jgi:putative ABC transport system permease protein